MTHHSGIQQSVVMCHPVRYQEQLVGMRQLEYLIINNISITVILCHSHNTLILPKYLVFYIKLVNIICVLIQSTYKLSKSSSRLSSLSAPTGSSNSMMSSTSEVLNLFLCSMVVLVLVLARLLGPAEAVQSILCHKTMNNI